MSVAEVSIFRRAARFGLSGIIATAIHVSVAVLLVSQFQWHPAWANAMAVACATVFSYVANTLWSFSSAIDGTTLLRFLCVSIGITFFAGAVSGVAEWVGIDYRIGIALVVVSIPPLTFWLHHNWTYRK